MFTEENAEDITAVLVRLMTAYTDYPLNLAVTYRTMPGRVDWQVCPDVNDMGKLIGARGAHVKALQRVLQAMGDKYGQQFKLRLIEGSGVREGEPVRRPAPDYNPADKKLLLGDVLGEMLDAPAKIGVEATGKNPPAFTFNIAAGTHQDDERLCGQDYGPSALEALEVLFDAIGKKDGVEFSVVAAGTESHASD